MTGGDQGIEDELHMNGEDQTTRGDQAEVVEVARDSNILTPSTEALPKNVEPQLSSAKRAYRQASTIGNRQEEARWANMIGDIFKNRGEYVEALKWLRIDYEISIKFLPEKQLLPTCQSLGEVYLRLQEFKEALIYQKKHLELAKDTDDLIEQQRASTQLGRSYHEMFLKSEDDHYAVRNAKKYFRLSMKLACSLKEKALSNKLYNFLKEFIDAHNNLGMLEMDLDNLEEAERILLQGLKICDEEEVIEDDDGRSRLHHNLGSVYMELRMWNKARDHIEKDIIICKKIGHRQGEAKGYINLGELHYRVQKYDEALLCYQKALDIARSIEDEDVLVDNIDQNIETVKEAVKVMDDLRKEEQTLKKLARTTTMARGSSRERKCLLQQSASLDSLIEKSSIIFAWLKHLEFAKRKKRVASELGDKEKLSDSYLSIGESYHKLRNFIKARKWYTKSLNTYKSIGNLEGQALAKVNIGDILDSEGDWTAYSALNSYNTLCRIAVEAKLHSVQISALDNMHYSHMIRFDNVEEARSLQLTIKDLKSSRNTEIEAHNLAKECCSETETEGDGDFSDNNFEGCSLPNISESASTMPKPLNNFEDVEDDVPLSSFLCSNKRFSKAKISQLEKPNLPAELSETSPKGLTNSMDSQHQLVGRKRVRVILSDDETDEVKILGDRIRKCPSEDVATSSEFMKSDLPTSFPNEYQSVSHYVASKDIHTSSTPLNLEESACSYKSRSSKINAKNGDNFRSSSLGEVANVSNMAASGSRNFGDHVSDNLLQTQKSGSFNLHTLDDEHGHFIPFKVDDNIILVDARCFKVGNRPSMEYLKVEVACLYYLQLSEEKRSRGDLSSTFIRF
ncbi:hypothetical protein GIB67_018326 [Kingdonia uniflora]|uniref:TONSOKU n=1 Tax=Kingdonia uniflora TaxID=39325 RepID=A0A7J7MJ04_9MAGN|nr:hypothetical protein GIB67_018326 [Kingdonia uniflora]